jgi:hypothetical protein
MSARDIWLSNLAWGFGPTNLRIPEDSSRERHQCSASRSMTSKMSYRDRTHVRAIVYKEEDMANRSLSVCTSVLTQLTPSRELGLLRGDFDLYHVERLRLLDSQTYWVRIRTVVMNLPWSAQTAIFGEEQLAQSLSLDESCYLAHSDLMVRYRPDLAEAHPFCLYLVTRWLKPGEYLVHMLPASLGFTGLPRKTALAREQLVRVLPVPEWRKRYKPRSPERRITE